MTKGMYRDGEWAQVDYDGKEAIPIPREQYEAQGYLPLFNKLPTKAEYEASNTQRPKR